MFCRFAGLAGVVACFASTSFAFNFTKIWVAQVGDDRVSRNFAVNDAGDVVFGSIEPGSTLPSAYLGRFAGNIPITIIGSNLAPTVDGPISLSNTGTVAFQSFTPGNPDAHGIFTRNAGGQHFKDAVPPRGKKNGAPSTSDNGNVVFLSMDDSVQVRMAGGITGSIPSLPFSSSLSRPSINNAGQVAVTGALASGQAGIAVGRIGGGTPITIVGDWRMASSQPQITNNNAVLFTVEEAGSGIPTGRRQHKLAVPDPSTGGFSVSDIGDVDEDCDGYINDSLSVACVDGDKLKIFISDTNNNLVSDASWSALTLLSIGDALDGSTVMSLALGDGSMMADNSVVFHATLADGSSGIYQAVIPEPASIGLVGGSLLLIRRRR